MIQLGFVPDAAVLVGRDENLNKKRSDQAGRASAASSLGGGGL